MKLGLLHRGEYDEPVRLELEQLVAAVTTSYGVEHDAEGQQRRVWARWNLGANLSIAGGGAVVLVPCRLPDRRNTGDLTVDPVSGVVTVVTAGVYHAIGQIAWTANATGMRGAILTVDQGYEGHAALAAVGGGEITVVQVTATMPCARGATIGLAGLQTSGGALSALAKFGTAHDTYLTIARVA